MDALPPFDALIAFDAVLRHASMARAAAELGLTPSAVSHRVRRLEAFMGAPLLLRRGGHVQPTAAGAAVAEGLGEVLGGLAGLRARSQGAAGANRLRVGVGAALADHWLVRRLPDFGSRHPRLAVELVVVESEAAERAAEVDLRILWLPAEALKPGSMQRPLFHERVFPVCHPSLLPAGHVPGAPGTAALLAGLPLLHKGPAGIDQRAAWSWAAWFERLGLRGPPREALRFASIGPAIAAALQGAGVVLARSMLVHDALAEGRLVRLLPPAFDQRSGKAHVVRWPASRRADERVHAFADWLVQRAEATAAEAEREAAAGALALESRPATARSSTG